MAVVGYLPGVLLLQWMKMTMTMKVVVVLGKKTRERGVLG